MAGDDEQYHVSRREMSISQIIVNSLYKLCTYLSNDLQSKGRNFISYGIPGPADYAYNDPLGPAPPRPRTGIRRPDTGNMESFENEQFDESLLPE